MSVRVKLSDVIEALNLSKPDWQSYLNPDTGEIVTVTDEEREIIEGDQDSDDLPDWQREMIPKLREAIESNRFLALPDSFEIHEWSVMERFALHRSSDQQCQELLDSLHGHGAFRMFRSAIHRLGIVEDWHRFRDATIEAIAKGWLEENGIPFE
jgi:hypothetical protein